MYRKFETVTSQNLPKIIERIKQPENVTKCLIVNTRQAPIQSTRHLDCFGCGGYDLTKPQSRDRAIETLTGLMSIPESAGKVLCEII